MPSRATVTSKGQITIPQEVRQRLGLKQGDQVEFITEHGVTMIKPARGEVNPFSAYAGTLGGFRTQSEVTDWIDDLRSEEDDD